MPKSRCRPRAVTRAARQISSTVSSSGDARASGTWVVIGTVRRLGPASIITTLPRRDAAALGDEFGLAGMGEADRVELRLGDRAR